MKKIFLLILTIGILMANRLEYRYSPYLKQHADNPVNCMSDEAFEKVKKGK